MTNNTFVIVDIASLYFCVSKKYNGKLNYAALLTKLKEKYDDIGRITAYGVQGDNNIEKFVSALSKLGFETKYTTPAQQLVQITLDAVKTMHRVSRVVLVTSNTGLLPLVHHLRDGGVTIELLSCGIPRSMKFLPFEEIGEELVEKRYESTEATQQVDVPADGTSDVTGSTT